MQMLQTTEGLAPVHTQGKLVSIALVGSLHLAVIYTLLVALDIVPNPVAPIPPVSVRVIPQTKTTQPLPAPVRGVVLTHPALPNPMPPPIDIDASLPRGPTAVNPNVLSGPVAPIQPVGTTLPVRPLSATHTSPPYPAIAIRLGYEGTVLLRIVVDEHGSVASAEVQSSSGHTDLDEAAVAWVQAHWRYAPATRNGNPAKADTTAVVTFRLNQTRG